MRFLNDRSYVRTLTMVSALSVLALVASGCGGEDKGTAAPTQQLSQAESDALNKAIRKARDSNESKVHGERVPRQRE